MSKIITSVLMICLAYFPATSYAETMNLTLASHQSKTIANNFLWTINANCTIHSTEDDKTILVSSVKSGSKINGNTLISGHKTSVKVNDNDVIVVSAEPGAKVSIINTSSKPIKACCST
ncbi:MAG: hypothetical protein P1U74_08185 [Legionellaceae bacterium]|nr:hypothetical protein [Legionellaceae bacterium]